MDKNELNRRPPGHGAGGRANSPALFVVPKAPPMPRAKVVTYTASGQVVIQSEFSEQLEALTKTYIDQYQPIGVTELSLVRDMAAAQCRCEYTLQLQNQPGVAGDEKIMASLTRYQKASLRMFKRSLRVLQQLQNARSREAARKLQLVKPKTTGEC